MLLKKDMFSMNAMHQNLFDNAFRNTFNSQQKLIKLIKFENTCSKKIFYI